MREADFDAYDLDDPKHPDWEDQAAERADLERKRAKEDALLDGARPVVTNRQERSGLARSALPEADRQRILLAPERTQGFPLSRAEPESMSKRGKRAWVFLGLACLIAGMFILVEQARAHNLPGTRHNREHAITHAFCGSLRPCPMGEKALEVGLLRVGAEPLALRPKRRAPGDVPVRELGAVSLRLSGRPGCRRGPPTATGPSPAGRDGLRVTFRARTWSGTHKRFARGWA